MNALAINGGRPLRSKPFPSWPVFDQSEENALLSVLRSGHWWNYSFGDATRAEDGTDSHVGLLQRAFARRHDAPYGIACANGTAALEVALRALGIGPGDEVIVPPYTFVATATAPLQVGAAPVFCDIDPETYNLDPERMKEAITPRTKAVIPVHFAGLAADLGSLMEITRRHDLRVVEDAAHGHGGSWQGRGLGSIGDIGTFSFQVSKNMTAGEGGMIVTSDKRLAELCESLVWGGRETGHEWYEHFRLGWNYRLTEFQAAILLQQMERLHEQVLTRNRNAAYLNQRLTQVPGIYAMAHPEYATQHAYHIFLLRYREDEFGLSRQLFLDALNREGIPCLAGYAFPLYKNPLFLNRQFGGFENRVDYRQFEELCPVAERACREAIWLEHRLLLGSTDDMNDIVGAVRKIHGRKSELTSATVRNSSEIQV